MSIAGRCHINRPGSTISAEGYKAASKAARSISGSFLPRFSARFRIPAHARGLKKYFSGIKPFSSTCNNEDSTASLGHSEVLSVEHAPREAARWSQHSTSVLPFPPSWRLQWYAFPGQHPEETSEGVAFVAENSRHVFPQDDDRLLFFGSPLGVDGVGEGTESEREVSTGIFESFPCTSNTE